MKDILNLWEEDEIDIVCEVYIVEETIAAHFNKSIGRMAGQREGGRVGYCFFSWCFFFSTKVEGEMNYSVSLSF